VAIGYAGRKKDIGHTYRYEADRGGTLRLGAETQSPGFAKNPGVFRCPTGGPALYHWTRSDDYTVLRLRAIHDPCAVRQRILEADWSFVD
jgi:hypothetical protein